MGRLSRSVLDSELKLHLLIWSLSMISKVVNFEKSNTGEM